MLGRSTGSAVTHAGRTKFASSGVEGTARVVRRLEPTTPRLPPEPASPSDAVRTYGRSEHRDQCYAAAMSNPIERITVDPEQCGGRACIRGLRIRVIDILDLLAAGLDQQQVLAELPDLEAEDITAALLYARRRLDHPVLAA